MLSGNSLYIIYKIKINNIRIQYIFPDIIYKIKLFIK